MAKRAERYTRLLDSIIYLIRCASGTYKDAFILPLWIYLARKTGIFYGLALFGFIQVKFSGQTYILAHFCLGVIFRIPLAGLAGIYSLIVKWRSLWTFETLTNVSRVYMKAFGTFLTVVVRSVVSWGIFWAGYAFAFWYRIYYGL